MTMCEVFLGLGSEQFGQALRAISPGKLKLHQMFDAVRIRLHLSKLNQESLKKAAPKVWARIEANEEDLARDISQAILVCHMDMIIAVLDLTGIPHEDGFFGKDADVKTFVLPKGWQDRAYSELSGKYPPSVLALYLNQLAHEVDENAPLFRPKVN